MALPCGAAPFVKVFLKSIFGRVGGQIFLDHQRHLKDDGIIEVAQVKAGQLADLLKTVDQRVAVNEQTAACLGDVQVVLKEALDGEQGLLIQTFNAAHQGSEVTEIKAKSGAAPSTTTEKSRTEMKIEADQLSTNAQEPSEGPIKNLIDGKGNTFFHTRWSSPQIELPHYIQIDFKEAHEDFAIYYQNRTDNTWTSEGRPSVVELQISSDGKTFETVATLSGLPSAHSTEYTSEFVVPGKTFTSFRFNVIATSGNTKYFNLAQFKFYDVEVEIYDPETVPLD